MRRHEHERLLPSGMHEGYGRGQESVSGVRGRGPTKALGVHDANTS